jgi:L-iditol 2-dehydrogenase
MTTSMAALVYYGAHDLRLENVPVPQISAKEILLQVSSASICGTDLRIYHGNHRKYPEGTIRIPGHEVVGVITNIGENVQDFQAGQRVFIAPNIGCGHCRLCIAGKNNLCPNYQAVGVTIDGGFAEYMRIPEQAILQGNVMPISDSVDPAVAALIEPFACVLRGQNALNIQPGNVVLVMGAGPIGIMHIKLARLRGAGRVIVSEPAEERLAQAVQTGADRAVNPLKEDLNQILMEESNGAGADAIIVAAPAHQAQESALQLAAIGGRINFFGGLPKDKPHIQLDSNLVHYKELVITGTTACSTYDCWQAAEIINSGRIELSDIISRRFPLSDALEAFNVAEQRTSLKVVIEP